MPSPNAVSTPAGSLRRSQRETCTTAGAAAGSGDVPLRSTWRTTRPGLPSSRV